MFSKFYCFLCIQCLLTVYLQRGPNKVPIYSLVLITLVALLFVLVGDVNSLAPIVTTAFMMSYAAINYAYFALAMSYDRQQKRELRFGAQIRRKSADGYSGVSSYGSTNKTEFRDSFQTMRTDLDKLFPERLTHHGPQHVVTEKGDTEATFDAMKNDKSADNVSEVSDASQVLLGEDGGKFV